MKIEIEISKEDFNLMLKNRYGHDDVLTKDYMLDILHIHMFRNVLDRV